jgi:integrase
MPLSLAGARKLAMHAASQVAMGTDPAAVRVNEQKEAKQQAANAIEAVVADFIKMHARRKTKAYSAQQAERYLNFEVVSQWRGRTVQEITRRDINALLHGIVERGSPISANRTLSHLSKMFAWCVEQGIVETSPCTNISKPSKETPRDRVLTEDELKLVWQATSEIDGPFGSLVKMLILTLQRRGEVAGMHHRELRGDLWTIPKERAKNGVETTVPLAQAALDVLAGLPQSGFLFTIVGAAPLTSFYRSKERLDREIAKLNGGEPIPAWTLHDLRRTGATGLQKLGVRIEVVEKILNHQSGVLRGVAGVYQRFDYASDRRKALDDWARHVLSLTSGESSQNILPFRR